MDIIDQLTKKVQTAAHELVALKKEKQQFLSEIELLRHELQQFAQAGREIEAYKRNQERIRIKLEKINKKIEKQMMSGQSLTFAGGGNSHE